MQLRDKKSVIILIVLAFTVGIAYAQEVEYEIKEYKVPRGTHPHDVAPAPDGTVWYHGSGFGGAKVRQILGRKGEVWGAESAVDKLVVIRQK